MNPKKQNPWRDVGDVGTVGLEFVLSIALGWYVGHWADARWFGGRGWATAIGSCFGVIAAFKAIHSANERMKRRLEELEREEHEHRT